MKKLGFSLVELLVVIAIMGVLFSVSVPSFSHYYRKFSFQNTLGAVETVLQKGFSGARAMSSVFNVSGVVGGGVSLERESEVIEVVDLSGFIVEKIEFEMEDGDVLSGVGEFEVRFFPPHGDVVFVGYDDAVILRIVFSDGDSLSKIVQIYKNSGFVEIK